MPPRPRDGAELLALVAGLGGYFALTPVADDEAAGALPFDGEAVEYLVDRTRSAIAASAHRDRASIPVALAASSFHLNVVSRLLSPVIGAAVAYGEVPVLDPDSVGWLDAGDHVPRIHTTASPRIMASGIRQAAESISDTVVATIVEPLNEVLRSAWSLSTHISRGNTISAANGAVTVLSMSRPERERPGRALVAALLGTDRLAGTGHVVRGTFYRNSCCLFYRAPGAGLCGDCVLAAPRE